MALGIPAGPAVGLALEWFGRKMREGASAEDLRKRLLEVVADPSVWLDDAELGALAREIYSPPWKRREKLAPWRTWGTNLELEAVRQMANACSLEVAVAGALMPDAHTGYGLPIGGVLATDNAVIPYAVGVDIACRMRLTVFDRPASTIAGMRDRLANILEDETRFGMGAEFRQKREHPVMDEDWSVSPVTKRLRDKAHAQLGTSGSGNHFVEFGALTILAPGLGVPEGTYLALLSHSGSRGTGAQVCDHYSKVAMNTHTKLPKELRHLAWLGLDTQAGQEYWAAMTLMGKYAAANHEVIHKHIAKKVGASVLATVENHHNFAWKEVHVIEGREREVIVHRKGATPAALGVLGVIPGSMATPGFVVRGLGEPASLHSAAHGAGRVMSRRKALESFTWSAVRKQLEAAGVEVLSAGLDEVPGVYKNINEVMAAQKDLVEVIARFDPKIVKMSPAGERAED